MMIKGPQNIYNSLPSLDTQNPLQRPEVNRGIRTNIPSSGERLEGELQTQSQSATNQPTDVSLQQVKNLSDVFNTYRSYVNQLDATDRIVNRVAYGVAGITDLTK
jgi:hypothetical protein